MNKKQISRRGFLKGIGQTAVAAVLANILKFVPEAQEVIARGRPPGPKPEIYPLGSDDPLVVGLKTTAASLYNSSAFGGEPDWREAKLYTRYLDESSSQSAVMVPISTDAEETLFLAAPVQGGNLAEAIIVGITLSITLEELRANQSFSGTIAAYRLDGTKVSRIVIQDNRVVGAPGSVAGKAPGLARPVAAICCPPEFWACMAEGAAACVLCCCYTIPTCLACAGFIAVICGIATCYQC